MYVLFTDTDTDITLDIANELGYNLISMPYSINDEEIYPYESQNFSTDFHEFYELLRNGAMPKTSGISPEKYYNYFEPFFKEGKDVLYVHFSSKASGTFSAMNLAYEELKKKYPERTLYTLDTLSISISALSLLYDISDMYKQGKTPEEIIAWGETERTKYAMFFYAENLNFFKRSGRVKNFTALIGNILGIHPIIHVDDNGNLVSVDKARGKQTTINKIMEYVDKLQDNIKDYRVIVIHADNLEGAKLLDQKLKDKYGEDLKTQMLQVNPTIGCHCGPDVVGLSFRAKSRI